jgi:tripartite-type tricarboxylate transporter receptor subunit TctC
MKLARNAVVGLLACASAAPAFAQEQPYPNRPIRLIVGFAPGGNTDTVARLVGQRLAERLGTTVVVDNRDGAGGTIGTALAARASPDGHTLTMGTTTTHAIAVAAHPKLPYDPVKDFSPLALVAIAPYLLVVHHSVPANTLKELVALAKAQPGKLNYGSAGQATMTHLVMATLAGRAGLDMVHIPFKGNGPATTAVLAGEVQVLFGAIPPLMAHVKGGKLRPLAVSTAQRLPALPDVPTVAEAGFPGFDMSLWLGFFAPAGTPPAIVKRLEAALTEIAKSPDMKEQMQRQGMEPHNASAAQLAQLVKAEIETYRAVFKGAGIKIE